MTRYGSSPTDRQFTGQRKEDASLGSLYDYGARMYSSVLGRFLSADTMVPSPGNPQSLNRYSYVLNSPLVYVDPTGHMQACADGDEGGGCGYGEPKSPTWFIDRLSIYDDPAPALAQADKWYEAHPDYNLFQDPKVWTNNYGVLEPKFQYQSLARAYYIWKALRGEGGLLQQQAAEQEVAWLETQGQVPAAEQKQQNQTRFGFLGLLAALVSPFGFPQDPTQPPAPGFQWKGNGPPGSTQGSWWNPHTDEVLHYDETHHGQSHYDYRGTNGIWYRIWSDGSMDEK